MNEAIQTSDAHLKQRIANLRYGLNQVMQLRPVTFQWKDGSDRRTHLGLIAQEVEPVMPEMVEKGAEPSAPLGMNYNNLIPVLVNAMKQQQQQISALRKEKAALDVRLTALEKRTERRTHTRHRRTGSKS